MEMSDDANNTSTTHQQQQQSVDVEVEVEDYEHGQQQEQEQVKDSFSLPDSLDVKVMREEKNSLKEKERERESDSGNEESTYNHLPNLNSNESPRKQRDKGKDRVSDHDRDHDQDHGDHHYHRNDNRNHGHNHNHHRQKAREAADDDVLNVSSTSPVMTPTRLPISSNSLSNGTHHRHTQKPKRKQQQQQKPKQEQKPKQKQKQYKERDEISISNESERELESNIARDTMHLPEMSLNGRTSGVAENRSDNSRSDDASARDLSGGRSLNSFSGTQLQQQQQQQSTVKTDNSSNVRRYRARDILEQGNEFENEEDEEEGDEEEGGGEGESGDDNASCSGQSSQNENNAVDASNGTRNTSRNSNSSNGSTTSNGNPNLASELLLDPKRQRFSVFNSASGNGADYNEIPTYPLRPSYKEYHAQLRPASQTVVFDGCPDNPYRPASVPIYQTATFAQPSSTEYGAYDYTRSGNPTRTALERQVAMLENAHAAFAFTSGMSALTAVTRLLHAGDKIMIGADVYGGLHRLINRVTSLAGVEVVVVRTWELEEVRETLKNEPKVMLLHMETPSNPLMRITDIRGIADIAHEHGVLLSVDSTMMTPYLQKPLNHGADVVAHSLTKFFCGTSDTMGGAVCVANEALAKRIAFYQNAEGTGLSPFDCWLFLRGIKTLAIRVERSQQNAEHVAAFLSRHPLVKELFYAGMEPTQEEMVANVRKAIDYKIHMGQAKGGGSVLSFTTGSMELSGRIIDALRLFKLTVSFGSCNSLCEMPATLSHASIPSSERTLPDDMIRLSIGIEDVNDLIEDLQRAFTTAAAGVRGIESNEETLWASELRKSNSTMHTLDRTRPELPTPEDGGTVPHDAPSVDSKWKVLHPEKVTEYYKKQEALFDDSPSSSSFKVPETITVTGEKIADNFGLLGAFALGLVVSTFISVALVRR